MSKLAAVRFEGTITEGADPDILQLGTLKEGVVAKLEKLAETHGLIIVSSCIKHHMGCKFVHDFLIQAQIPFLDLWCCDGLPTVDLWVDDNAVKLGC